MKKIFEILQEEKDRILKMHQNATKNQYLNEQIVGGYNPVTVAQSGNNFQINPQILKNATQKQKSFTSTKWHNLTKVNPKEFIGISAGATFEVTTDSSILTAKNAKVSQQNFDRKWNPSKPKRVSYYCKKGKFYIQDIKGEFYDSTLSKTLNEKVCYYKDQQNQENEKNQQTKTTYSSKGQNDLIGRQDKNKKVTVPAKTQFTFYPQHNGVGFKVNEQSGWYGCKTSTFLVNKVQYDSKYLADALNKNLCVAPNPDTPNPDTPNPDTPNPGVVTEPNTTPSSGGNTITDTNTQIQQLLGNQSPTGQITDSEIDQILAKLG